MEQIIKFSKEELGAIKTIASIECSGISCVTCPLNVDNIPYSWVERGCIRNLACGILRVNEQKENCNVDKNT